MKKDESEEEEEDVEQIVEEEYESFGSREVQEVNRDFDARIEKLMAELEVPDRSGIYELPHESVKITPKPTHEYAD